jgi:D-alanyl-D-alanine dipeptidase
MVFARRLLGAILAAIASAAVATATSAPGFAVPPVSDQQRAAGLIDLRTVVPDALTDLRYATPKNFVGEQLYPAGARCLVHETMGPRLAAAADALRQQGDQLVFWDCYRPHSVQVRMWQAVPNPAWVAKPGPYSRSHESGLSVDVTMASGGRPIDMGTDFDDFTPRALAFATTGVSAQAQANRAKLRDAMKAGGLTVYSGEWWHFDAPGAGADRPILDVPVN